MEEVRRGGPTHLDVAKIWYDLLKKICSRTKHIDSVEFAFADISCIFV